MTNDINTSKNAIKIPKRFYEDHVERDLPAPQILKETNQHFFIDFHSEHLMELLSDASYYADPESYGAVFGSPLSALIRSARATESAIKKHLGLSA